MSLRSSAPAMLHALRTRYPGDAAPYLNQARATYPGGVSELDAALHLLHPPDEDLEVGEVTVFMEGADEASARPRPTNPVYNGTRPTPPYGVLYEAFPREPTWCPALTPATHAPRGLANPDLSPSLPRTRGAHRRGQVLWQECPGTPLLLLVVATRGDPGRILGIIPTHLYGATPVPRPPPPPRRPRRGTEYTPSCEHRRSLLLLGSTWCGCPRHRSTTPGGPGPWAPPQTGSYGATRGPRGSPASPPNAGGWPQAPGRAGLKPQPAPHPLPPSPPQSTTRHCRRHGTDAPGGSGKGAPATTHAYQGNSDGRLRWVPPAGRPPAPPVPLPLPRLLPGVDGGDPRGAGGAEAGGGGGAGWAAAAGPGAWASRDDRPRRPSSQPRRPAPRGGPRRAGSRDRSPSEPRRGPDRGPRHAADTGGQPRRRNRAHRRGLPQPQRRARRAREGLRPRPRRAAPPPRPTTPRPPASRGSGGRTPHGPRAPRPRPPRQRRRAGRAREGLRPRPWRAATPPRPAAPRPPARRERGGRTPVGPRAPRRRPPRQQRRMRRAREGLRPRPRRAAPPPRLTTPRPPARRESRGRTPHEPRAPRWRPPQQRRKARRAREGLLL